MLRRSGCGASSWVTESLPSRSCRAGSVATATGHYCMCARNYIFGFKRRTPGAMAEYMIFYFEASGHPSAVEHGLNMLRKLGTFVEYSVFGSGATIDWTIIGNEKELDVRGAHLGPHCWPAAIRLIESGRLPMEKICTHQLPLADLRPGWILWAAAWSL
jgi:Zn-dependent alcohol dehydrogenase